MVHDRQQSEEHGVGFRHQLGNDVVIRPTRLKLRFLEPLSEGVESLVDLDTHVVGAAEEPCRLHGLAGEARQAGQQAQRSRQSREDGGPRTDRPQLRIDDAKHHETQSNAHEAIPCQTELGHGAVSL
jgi:hypothetical protein